MIKLPQFPTRLSSHASTCMTAVGLSLLATNVTHAATMSFQEGVSPSGTYTTGGVTIRSNVPTANQNDDDEIIVGHYSSGILRGLLEFDLTAIETAAGGSAFTIDSVSLVMHTASVSTTGNAETTFNLNLLDTNSDFNEATATWTNAPSTAGGTQGTFLSSVAFIPTSNINVDQTFATSTAFTTAVGSALSTDVDNTIRFILSTNETGSSSFARFVSDEVATLANRPELIVNYTIVPEPSAFALLLGGLSALACFRRRQRK